MVPPEASGSLLHRLGVFRRRPLRQRAGLPALVPSRDSPGVRLAALWAAYDAMTPTQQRAAFGGCSPLPGTARDADVTLPKGSTDIHLFHDHDPIRDRHRVAVAGTGADRSHPSASGHRTAPAASSATAWLG